MRLLALPLVFSLLATVASSQDPEKVHLAWKFTKGESLRYEMTYGMDMNIADMEMKQEILSGFTMGVQEVNADGSATVEMRYDRVKIKMTGIMEVEYDSDAPKKEGEKKEGEEGAPDIAGMMSRAMGAMVGKSFTVKMSPKGEMSDIKGFDKIMEAMSKEFGDEGGGEMLKGMYSEDQVRQMFQSGFGFVPGRAVAKGESWDNNAEFKLEQLGTMSMKSKLTLKDIKREGKEAAIKMDTKIEVKGDEGAMVEVSDGKMNSELTWSVELGRLEAMSGTMTMKMAAAGQEFDISAAITMKLAPKKDRKDH
jgi:hypothetical protein